MKGNAVFYIEESGMNFGPFVPERCFHVEKSPLYAKVSDRGVKTCEFVNLDKNSVLCFVEAKSSSPRPDTKVHFDEFMSEVENKLKDTFYLFLAILFKRFGNDIVLPDAINTLDMASAEFKFYLVIKGHKTEWLLPIADELKQRLRSLAVSWHLSSPSVFVINDTIAREDLHLIV